jgi:hypothetical protein
MKSKKPLKLTHRVIGLRITYFDFEKLYNKRITYFVEQTFLTFHNIF